MRLTAAIIVLTAFTSSAQSHAIEWKTSCDDEAFSLPVDQQSHPLVVNENQIVISVHTKSVAGNKIGIFLDKTLDLGTGGMMLNWDNFSKTAKIADMTFKGREAVFRWYGFFDNVQQKRVWVAQPDFVETYAKNGQIKLITCD